MKLDQKFTEKLQQWLASDHSSEDAIKQGALLLLQLNGKKALYANICRTPLRPRWRARLEYELKKYLKIRLDGLTRDEVAALDNRVTKEADVILSYGTETPDVGEDGEKTILLKGKRADHDQLPEEIQNLFTSCGGIYKKIRKLHTQLRSMENEASCDRYEYLTQLDELDETYRKRMKEYDGYTLPENPAEDGTDAGTAEGENPDINSGSEEDTTEHDGGSEETDAGVADSAENEEPAESESESGTDDDTKTQLNNERSYIKRLKDRLAKAYEHRNESEVKMQEYEDLLQDAYIHINKVFALGGTFTNKVREPLRELGIKFPDEAEKTDEQDA